MNSSKFSQKRLPYCSCNVFDRRFFFGSTRNSQEKSLAPFISRAAAHASGPVSSGEKVEIFEFTKIKPLFNQTYIQNEISDANVIPIHWLTPYNFRVFLQ